jgi:L-iditol 2-dehydrogenase
MKGSMRAVLYLGPGRLELRRVPVPAIGEGELLVRVRAATTCGTDAKTYQRGHPKFTPPFVFGHEFAGDIVEVGSGVTKFVPGMRVTANIFAPCGTCYYCIHEQGNLCEAMEYNWGAYAEYIRIPTPIVKHNTFEIPKHIPYAQAAVLEPLVSVVHGQRLIHITPGETCAIFGAGGPVGLMHLQMARHSGAVLVIAIDPSEERLAVARTLGAHMTVNPQIDNPLETIRLLTAGVGVDVAIECAGRKETWQASLKSVRKGGRVLLFGGLPGGTMVEVDPAWIHYGELEIRGTHGGTPLDAANAMKLIASGVIDTSALITCETNLEGVEEALKLVLEGKVIKVAVIP